MDIFARTLVETTGLLLHIHAGERLQWYSCTHNGGRLIVYCFMHWWETTWVLFHALVGDYMGIVSCIGGRLHGYCFMHWWETTWVLFHALVGDYMGIVSCTGGRLHGYCFMHWWETTCVLFHALVGDYMCIVSCTGGRLHVYCFMHWWETTCVLFHAQWRERESLSIIDEREMECSFFHILMMENLSIVSHIR